MKKTGLRQIAAKSKLKVIILVAAIALIAIPLLACNKNEQPKTSYAIRAIFNEESMSIDGNLTVSYVNQSEVELNEVMFHLYPRAYREGASISPIPATDRYQAYPQGVNYGDLAVLRVVRDGTQADIQLTGEDEDILKVEGRLMPAASTTIEIDFKLELPKIRHRLGYHDGIINLGNWYPIVCMIKDGQFDATPYYANGDPFNSDIADYNVSITVPQKYKVATSGRQSETVEDGLRTVSASLTNARDTAAVIGEFDVLTQNQGGVEIKYYYKNDDAAAAHLKTAADALKYFENTFGGYIYDSLSVVKTPFLHGGMEYPALVYISDMLGDSLFNEVIIHEIAHQWWYAAVGNDQIREAWLDEALAEYSTTLFYEFNPSYGVTKEARLADALAGYILYSEEHLANGRGDSSMNRSTPQYKDQREYSAMTYVKGELMLDGLRDSIGDTAFFNGLKNYYKKYKFKRAMCDDFIGTMESSSKTELKGYFDSWIEGKVKMFAS